ncbi:MULTISPECIES: hypothetical protein [Morganellaceae]|uniref:hypothetical protein n=1 Tax=Morganellaceae TaxID=1903414 RepID=UPI001586DDE9|nr:MULTISPECIES: hypothetical protein [Providencia]
MREVKAGWSPLGFQFSYLGLGSQSLTTEQLFDEYRLIFLPALNRIQAEPFWRIVIPARNNAGLVDLDDLDRVNGNGGDICVTQFVASDRPNGITGVQLANDHCSVLSE